MKKLSLDVESLAVETFEAAVTQPARGTVAANAMITAPSPEWTCRYHCTWYPGTTCE